MLDNQFAHLLDKLTDEEQSKPVKKLRQNLVYQYMAHQLISVLEEKDVATSKARINQLITKLKALPKTKHSQSCLYQVFLTMLVKKELT